MPRGPISTGFVRTSLGFILGRCCRCKTVRDMKGPGAAMALSLDVSRTGDIVVVTCRGRIVFGEEADELRRVVLDLLKETKRIVLNLAGVGYIDSSGLGTLVASFISARHRKAEIKFAALSPRTHRALTITNVNRLFEVYESSEQAVKSFRR